MKISIFSSLFILLLYGCAVKPVGYFDISPYAKPLDSKIYKTVNVIMKEKVLDSFMVEGEGIKGMKVTKFRSTLQNGLTKILNKNFAKVVFKNEKVDSQINIVIYRVKAFWKIGSSYTTVSGSGGYTHSQTHYLISPKFQFESSLFYNGEKIGADDSECVSEGTTSNVYGMPKVFMEGTRIMCEHINKTLFDDVNLKKIK